MAMKNKTRRALVLSVLSLILCCSMLVGTTFAWFTDSVTSGVNKINSGNLDISLKHKYFVDNDFTYSDFEEVTSDTGLFLNVQRKPILWEPGAGAAERFVVKNEGSLALKYQFKMAYTNASATPSGKTLADVLKVQVISWSGENTTSSDPEVAIDGIFKGMDNVPLKDCTFESFLLPDESMEFEVYVNWLPGADDNEYNITGGLNMDLGIELVATQQVHEYDGIDNTYDENAVYPAASAGALLEVLENAQPGDVVQLVTNDYGAVALNNLKDVTIVGTPGTDVKFVTDANTVLENVTLSGFNIDAKTNDNTIKIDPNASIENLVIENSTFYGNGTKSGHALSGFNNNANITIKNVTFKDVGYPIYAWGGYESLTIENCTFDNIKSWAIMPQSGFDGDLTVTGCTFTNCLGGGLVKAGTLTAGHTFTFTNNTITGCTVAGDHNWFQFNTSAGTTVLSGNKMEGNDWTPGVAEGLK